MRRLSWRERRANQQADPGDLGAERRLFLFAASRLQAGDAQEPIDGADRRAVREERHVCACCVLHEKEVARSRPAVGAGAVAAKADSAARSIGCRGCRLDHFQGDGTTARLAGQWQEYLLKQMLGFRDESRGNNPGMSDLMKATPEDDFEALSQYLAGLQIDAYLGHGR